MCDPVSITVAGAAIGGGLGYAATGDAKGALIGAGLGAAGGFGYSQIALVPVMTGAGTAGYANIGLATGLKTMGISGSTALTGLSLVGTGLSALGTFSNSRSVARAADYRAGIANNNALIAEQNAILALEKGVADVEDKRLETRQRMGYEKTRLASMGFFVGEGSSVEILRDTAILGELDALRITADAENRANNFRQQAGDFRTMADLNAFASQSAKTAGNINTAGTLITGAADAGTTFLATKTV